jgi:hypothetical protein
MVTLYKRSASVTAGKLELKSYQVGLAEIVAVSKLFMRRDMSQWW